MKTDKETNKEKRRQRDRRTVRNRSKKKIIFTKFAATAPSTCVSEVTSYSRNSEALFSKLVLKLCNHVIQKLTAGEANYCKK